MQSKPIFLKIKKEIKMTALKKMTFLLTMICLVVFACKKDDPIIDPDPNPYDIPVKIVTSSIAGTVVDENLNPVENAIVTIGISSFQTDENGAFRLDNIQMNEYGTLVKVNKSGYFLAAKMVEAKTNQRSSTTIMLLEKTVVGSFDAAQGGTVTAQGNSKITLPANGVMTASGNNYSGEVTIVAKWLDPTDPNINIMMPGDLRAVNSDEELRQLATFGMMAVELEGNGGEALQVAEGSNATLELPVPAELQSVAPATIPLWHFDEATGYWVEEGEATFDGTKYVGEVSHFSFWNWDYPYPSFQLSGSVVDEAGNGVAGVQVSLTVNSGLLNTAYGWTNGSGEFSTIAPANEVMTIKIYNSCGDEIYSAEIGPFSDNTTLDPIVIPQEESLTLTGNLLDCDNNPIANGYLKVIHGNSFSLIYPDNSGAITGSILTCNVTDIEVIGYDLDALKQSPPAMYNISGLLDLDIGTINACEDLSEFMQFEIDGVSFLLPDPSVTEELGNVSISATNPDDSTQVFISLQTPGTTGVFNPDYANFTGITPIGVFYFAYCQGCPDFEVTITAFGNVGEIVQGSFTGTMPGDPNGGGGGTVSVSGTFKAIRDQ